MSRCSWPAGGPATGALRRRARPIEVIGAPRVRPTLLVAILAACLSACRTTPRGSPLSPAAKSYLETVKAAFGGAWKPRVIDAASRNDPTGCLYSTRDRRTVLTFTVEGDGQISDIRVATSSGARYLDEVAVESIKSVRKLDPPPPEVMKGAPRQELPFAFTLRARDHAERCSRPGLPSISAAESPPSGTSSGR